MGPAVDAPSSDFPVVAFALRGSAFFVCSVEAEGFDGKEKGFEEAGPPARPEPLAVDVPAPPSPAFSAGLLVLPKKFDADCVVAAAVVDPEAGAELEELVP